MLDISVIVVTYNTGGLIRECLGQITQASLEVIVVDNASVDETVSIIEDEFPTVKLIKNQENLGFGVANNQGVEVAKGQYVIILNPDLIISPEAIQEMAVYLEEHAHIGIVGPCILNAEGSLSLSARPPYSVRGVLGVYFGLERLFPALIYEEYERRLTSTDAPQSVAWLQGACLMMKKSLFNTLGGFDEHFFLFAEDTDLCDRVWQGGYEVVYFPRVTAKHYESTSVSRFPYISVLHYHTSPLYYFRKRHQPLKVWLLKLGFSLELFLKMLSALIKFVRRTETSMWEKFIVHARVMWQVWRY